MARFVVGLVIGLAIGAAAVVIVYFRGGSALQDTSAKHRVEVDGLRQEVQLLNAAKQKAEGEARATTERLELSDTKVDELQEHLKSANAAMASMQAQITEMQRHETGLESTEPESNKAAAPKPEGDPEDEELLKAALEMRERYKHLHIVGQSLSEAALKELELDESTAARINEYLKDELTRATKAIADFYRENIPDAPENLSELNAQEMIMKMLPVLGPELQKIGELSKDEQVKLMRGEKDVLDYMPRDSMIIKLGWAFHQVRQETYSSVERELPPDKMDTFKEKYLPPDDYVFQGNLNFVFGKIDWEKKRE